MTETIAFDDIVDGEEPPFKRQKPDWEMCGLESRRYEEEELLTPSLDRSACFGCVVVGERDKTTVDLERVVDLIKIIRKSVARCDPVVLARHVAREYAKLRHDINMHLPPDEAPLPEWPASMVLDHIRNHHTDPELQTWLRLKEIQELIQVSLRSMVEQAEGDMRINPQQFRVYQDLVKLYYQVAKTDFTKCCFRSNEALIDIKAACQPVIAVSDKTIVDYFERIA